MLTIFMMFASKTEASKLNLLKGSPHKWLTQPIIDYITKKGAKIYLNHKVDEIICGGRSRRDGIFFSRTTEPPKHFFNIVLMGKRGRALPQTQNIDGTFLCKYRNAKTGPKTNL